MKKIVFLFALLGLFFLPKAVFADYWTDEGNYNPNWRSKCGNICNFTDERDLAGVLHDINTGEISSNGRETDFAVDELDFTAHDWINPHNFTPLLGVGKIKVRYGQNFRVYNNVLIEYLFTATLSTNNEHGTASIDRTEGYEGDVINVTVQPEVGYTASVKYSYGLESNNPKHDLNKIDDQHYSMEFSERNPYIQVSFSKISFQITHHLGQGVHYSLSNTAYYGDHKTFKYTVESDYEISSVKVNGNSVQITNNQFTIDVYENLDIVVETVKRPRDNVTREGAFDIYFAVSKSDQLNRFLSGVSFQLYDTNNIFQTESGENNSYYLLKYPVLSTGVNVTRAANSGTESTNSYYFNYSLLTDADQNFIDSITRYGDLSRFSDRIPTGQLTDSNYNYVVKYMEYLPFVLDEVQAPFEYHKEKYIVAVPVSIEFVFFVDNNGTVQTNSPLVEQRININSSEYGFLKYDASILNEQFSSYYKENQYNTNVCFYVCNMVVINGGKMNIGSQGLADGSSDMGPTCNVPIVNYLGTPQLRITNSVNNKGSLVVHKKEVIEYKIIVENIGTAVSTENTIVTKLPQEVEYERGSATDNGVYDEATHTITWVKDVLDEGDQYEYSYHGIIKDSARAGIEYVGESYVLSREVDKTYSDKTVLTLLTNPLTFQNRYIVIVLLALVLDVILIGHYSNRKKEKKSTN